MDDLERTVDQAQDLSRERRWGAAALAWARAAMQATELEQDVLARQAWDAAGEAWRRDDQPHAAARALHRALDLAHGDPVGTALARVKLAGVLSELGRVGAALDLCRAAADVEVLPLRLLAIDGCIAGLKELGEKDALRELVDDLARQAEGPLASAAWFRRGQLLRLDGVLDEAEHAFGRVIALLEDDPAAEVGVAAAECEIAETALLRGETDAALPLCERARERHEAAGRRALQWRAMAGRVRATAESGVPVIVAELDEALAWARGRDLSVLEADLRIARGMALAERDGARARQDLDRAIVLADGAGTPLRAGRARYERAWRVAAPVRERLDLLDVAEEQLQSSEPWRWRVRMAKAALLADDDPAGALDLAASCAARFASMSMCPDERRALDLIQTVSA